MASIDKLPNGKWRARWRTPDGASRSANFDRRNDAERHLTAMEHSKYAGGYVDPMLGRRTVADWCDAWFATTVNLRATTRARDEQYLRTHILPTFGKRPLAKVDHLAVVAWVAELSTTKAPATVVKAHQILSKMMRGAVHAGLIASNPCEDVPLPRIEREEMRFLGPDEVRLLAEEIDGRYRAFVLLGAYGGLRLGELTGLRRHRIDPLRARVDVAEILVEVRGHHQSGPPKTRAGRRSVPLPRFVVEELTEHVERFGVALDGLVFPAPEGGPVRASLFRRRFFNPAVERAGLEPLRIHDLRHSAVALWIAAGASPKEVAARAGHSSVVTVLDRYGHLLPGTEDRVNDALEAMGRGAALPPGSVTAFRRG